ncbi:hypothetical protein PG994_009574 [Apiospora phragmitis]|uniref:Uncharacterized protein n=1 Tax=Apiospora phragmitis TaxID=2905665 RepID=A0ABR1U6H6_9PEZI
MMVPYAIQVTTTVGPEPPEHVPEPPAPILGGHRVAGRADRGLDALLQQPDEKGLFPPVLRRPASGIVAPRDPVGNVGAGLRRRFQLGQPARIARFCDRLRLGIPMASPNSPTTVFRTEETVPKPCYLDNKNV